MNAVSQLLGHLPHGLAYAVVAGAILADSVLLVGAFIPTLTLLLTAGALARSGEISLPLIVATAATAVVAGDLLAHRTGQLLGTRLRTGRIGRRIPPAAWRQAERLMNRHGGRAVFIARFLPVARTLAPHFAGATRLPYRPLQRHRSLPVGHRGDQRRIRSRSIAGAHPHPGRTGPGRNRRHGRYHRHTLAAALGAPAAA
ncbi:VTT domain-containing protein [Streptomyces clavifer]|uniref:DedA family protein n=1 Tax=Streptomyces clavifer TaxID=68188 RepID=UPI002E81B91B|nr:VTT domain-containing protein [Streptomyces clavifer]WUC25963.1 VTT domain-containing protein [Streptomyces clavifer]